MWCLTVDAGSLLSVVKFDAGKVGAKALAEKHGATDPTVDYMLVRARVKASLGYVADVLEALYKGEVEGFEKPIIESMPSADYKYRTIITRDEWKQFMMFEIDGIDYDSHVKEETVRRQPEPKVKNLYSALSATWSAWAKLQDTPPYGGKSGTGTWGYSNKPDCKNCEHRELSHTVRGDKCNYAGKWDNAAKKMVGGGCACSKYEPKPAPVPPAGSLKKNGVAVGDSAPDPLEDEYPSLMGMLTDASSGDDFGVDENGDLHPIWCTSWDGDPCICGEEETEGTVDLDDSTDWVKVGSEWIEQELPVTGESKEERKSRNRRNARSRRAARRRQGISGAAV